MERVPTWSSSPYVGTFQYKTAGPARIHNPSNTSLLLPSNVPYIGSLRHDLPHPWFQPSWLTRRTQNVHTQCEPDKKEQSTQTDVDLSAFVIVNFHGEAKHDN